MNAKIALGIISQIPKDNIIEGMYTNHEDKCSIVGHLCRASSENPEDYSVDNCIYEVRNKEDVKRLLLGRALGIDLGKDSVEVTIVRQDIDEFIKTVDHYLEQVRTKTRDEEQCASLSCLTMHEVLHYKEEHAKDRAENLFLDMIKAGL